MNQRIIVGVDGSGPSLAALRWALAHQSSAPGELVLHHVVDDEWGQLGSEYAIAESHDGERILADAHARCELADRRAQSILTHGSPAWMLAREGHHGDLIVVGTHKTGYLRGRILGTRSIVVASVASCSVVVVPEDSMSHRHGVVVGVAADTESHAAVIGGAAEARRLGQELSLIHVAIDDTEAGRAVLAAAADLASTTAPGITIRRRIAHRRCSEALLDASRSASLLVLGASRTDPDRAGFLGSVTHEVLMNINAPVMVAR